MDALVPVDDLRDAEVDREAAQGVGLRSRQPLRRHEEGDRVANGDLHGLVEVGAKDDGAPSVDLAGIIERTPWGPDWNKRVMDAALEATGMKHFEDDVTLMSARIS